MMNLFKNPYVVGIGFIAFGVYGIISKIRFSKPHLLRNIFDKCEKGEKIDRIIGRIMSTLLLLLGVTVLIWGLFIRKE